MNLGKPVIDFTSYIAERTINFTGREWVFQAVNDWLRNPDGSRYFLLIGEPGSGKTAIASRLAQISQGAVPPPAGLSHLSSDFLSALHFCSARDSRWINPSVFAESLALQLAERYPAYAKTLAEKSVDQQIHIEVQQRIEQGQAVGVVINQLNVSGGTSEDIFNYVVREPLEALFQDGFNQQVAILTDGLDEALGYSGNVNIISLLAHLDELPPDVRFILTSRQDSQIERAFLNADGLELSAATYDQHNQNDIRRYVYSQLSNNKELAEKASQVEPASVVQIANIVSRKAEGNFLYIRFLLDAMAKGFRPLTALEGLPEGLDALHFDSLGRVLRLGKRDWLSEYAPFLGVLSVAQEGLTLAQLQAFTTQSEASIWLCLDDLQQFIEQVNPQDGKKKHEIQYRLYHQSFIDFLHRQFLSVKKGHIRNRFYLPAIEWHKKLADGCEQDGLSFIWEDDKRDPVEQSRRVYARQHYAKHLYHAGVQEWQRLFAVLNKGEYGRAKVRFLDPSMRSYAQDLQLGQQAASWEGWTLEEGIELLPYLWQYSMLQCSLVNRADRYPLAAFRILLLLGQEQRVMDLAELLTDSEHKVSALLEIANYFRRRSGGKQMHTQMLQRSYKIANAIKDRDKRDRALDNLVTALAEEGQWGYAKTVIDTIEGARERDAGTSKLGVALAKARHWEQAEAEIRLIRDDIERARALAELSEIFVELQEWKQAERIWAKLESLAISTNKGWVWSALAEALSKARQWDRVEAIIRRTNGTWERARALCELSKALAKSQLWERAENVIHMIEERNEKAEAWCELGNAFAMAQQWERAQAAWNEAEDEAWLDLFDKGGAYGSIATKQVSQALARAQQWERAKEGIGFLEINWQRIEALCELGETLLKANQREQAEGVWTEAEALIHTFEDDEERTKAMIALGKVLTDIQQWEQAEAVIQSAKEGSEKARALGALGVMLAQAQQWKQAEMIWGKAKAVARTIEAKQKKADPRAPLLDSNIVRAMSLIELGVTLERSQQREQAKEVWIEAETLIHTAKHSFRRSEAMQDLGIALAKVQQWEWAERVIGKMDKFEQKIMALYGLGEALVEVDQWKLAQEVWIEAEMNAKKSNQNYLIGILGMTFVKIHQWERAEKMVLLMKEEDWQQTMALYKLGIALAKMQQWGRAEAAIRLIKSDSVRLKGLSELGEELAKAQECERAEAIWTEVEEWINKTKRVKATKMTVGGGEVSSIREDRKEVMCKLGQVFARTHQWERAEALAHKIKESLERDKVLQELGVELAQAKHWERAELVIQSINESETRFEGLRNLGVALAEEYQWERADTVAHTIVMNEQRADILRKIAEVMANKGEYERLLHLVQHWWIEATYRDYALKLLPLANTFISIKPENGIAFCEALSWVDSFFLDEKRH